MKRFILLFITMLLFIPNVKAEEDLVPNAGSGILIEKSTGQILYEKNAHEKRPMASMTKIMSMLLVMEQIDKGKLTMEDEVLISENSANMGGSQVFLQPGETYKVHDLLKSVAIASGNDAVVALAEKVAGTEEEFVNMMNNKVKELGLKDTNFENPHGLDSENHYSTAYDMAMLGRELLKYEDILKFTSTYEDYLKKPDGSSIWLVNTNKLVRFYEGVDGLKTGYTKTAGYCLTATAKKNDMRLISVVMGEDSPDHRSSDTVKLLSYGFNNFKLHNILTTKEKVGEITIKSGKKEKANIYINEDATELLKNTDDVNKYKFDVTTYNIKAPVKKKDVVGILEIKDNKGKVITKKNLVINEDIEKANIIDYYKRNLKTIISGKN
ncbi:MAG: D-alanyl-D-alanine carboxypeptidase [Bacilli bacterium]|nr:D-alanyl-D-alanine carboxypeptidase [Bacilli bacterium]